MCVPENVCVKSIERDYWRLQLMADALSRKEESLHVQGRRRTTEPFWRPLVLPIEKMDRLTSTLADAVCVVHGFAGENDDLPSFPDYDILALCQGPYYRLELAETLSGRGVPSIMATLYGFNSLTMPVAHFIDQELEAFQLDVEAIAELIEYWNGAHPISSNRVSGASRSDLCRLGTDHTIE